MKFQFQACLAGACLFHSMALAQPHATDIVLSINEGKIVTNTAVPTIRPQRVFVATLGVASPDFTDQPGFDCELGTFPFPSSNGFNIRHALHAWDGHDFDAIANSQMLMEFGPLSRISSLDDSAVQGFTLQVASNGQWHRHFSYTLQSPASPGIYLLELEIYSSSSSLLPTNPFWLVFNQDASPSDVHAAAAWAKFHLAGECPADLDDGSGQGYTDQGVDINDLLFFLTRFEAGDIAADLDDGAGDGLPDGGVDINDLIFMLQHFEAGC